MKVFISINFDENDIFESVSLIALNDNVFFEEANLAIAWYDMIKYVTHEGLYQLNLPDTLYSIVNDSKDFVLKYFCVEKEDFLDDKEVSNLTYQGRKKVMEVIVPKKLKTFDAYKKYIGENRTVEAV